LCGVVVLSFFDESCRAFFAMWCVENIILNAEQRQRYYNSAGIDMSESKTPQKVEQEIEVAVMARGRETCGVHSLNVDIFGLLQSYLAREEFQAFLHANKHVHSEYISRRYISLNKKYSMLYYESASFRERILSMILNPRRQLAINLSACSGVTDVSMLGGVHTLNLSNCRGVTDVGMLGGVHTLNLSGCSGVTDVSMLGGVHTLDLSCCRGVTDVSMLGGVHTLDLSGCSGVTDVSMLG
jgi:hypothetical protein